MYVAFLCNRYIKSYLTMPARTSDFYTKYQFKCEMYRLTTIALNVKKVPCSLTVWEISDSRLIWVDHERERQLPEIPFFLKISVSIIWVPGGNWLSRIIDDALAFACQWGLCYKLLRIITIQGVYTLQYDWLLNLFATPLQASSR